MTRRDENSSTSSSGTPVPLKSGRVAFVGAGPGDPGMLTLRAVELLRAAEVVITEEPAHELMVRTLLGDQDLPKFVEGGSEPDGRTLTHHTRAQLVAQYGRHATVVRLLSGDPFAFTSAPDEAQACVSAGINFEVVPGVSRISSVPAYAGIPMTETGAGQVTVLTGEDVDWARHADAPTLVVLGSRATLAQLVENFVAAGRDLATPVAITSGGSTSQQTTLVSTLGKVLADAKTARIADQAVIVVGDVVQMREQLSWFETKPLFGWRVLVPRTKEQSAGVKASLRDHGAVPEEVPTISVEPPRNPMQMDKAVRGLVEGRYEWVAFTSANAVRAVRERLEDYGLDARAFSGLKIAAVGERTAAVLADWGLRADLVPLDDQSATGLLAVWPEFDADLDPINRVFLPRADIATDALVAGLVELGWECDDVTAYRTVRASPPPAPVREAIKTGQFDAVLFTSSSTVRNLVGIAGKPHTTTVIAVIGPQTAKAAQEHGLRVDVVADKPDTAELVEALARFGSARRAAQLEAGLPVTKPSDRKPGSRRRSTARV
jgi:uroporphyrinogen III methyltransferase / synthase